MTQATFRNTAKGAQRPPLSPDVLTVQQDCETLERELIFGTIKSYFFYKEMRDVVCPFDQRKGTYRPDFTVKKYNVLYRAVDSFWRRFDNRKPEKDMGIPPHHLSAYVIDWGNKSQIPNDTCLALSTEVQEEAALINEASLESSRALAQSDGFRSWLEGRVVDYTMGHLQAQKSLGRLTPESLMEVSARINDALTFGKGLPVRTLLEVVNSREENVEIIGPNRFLCLGGIGMLVGQTGLGKSSLLLQLLMCWCRGKGFAGLNAPRPLKILLIQSENDDGDLQEMVNGILSGLKLPEGVRREVLENIKIITVDSVAGEKFVSRILTPLLAQHSPDLVVLDPALAFIGGDSKEQADVGMFLRLQILPLIRRFNSACLLVHHTNKPPGTKTQSFQHQGDLSYLGTGSSEWANVPRMIVTLRNAGKEGLFELSVPKRGRRLGWKDFDGAPSTRRFIKHSENPAIICWYEAVKTDIPKTEKATRLGDTELMKALKQLIPTSETITKAEVIKLAKKELKIGKNRSYGLLRKLEENGEIQRSESRRKRGPAEILLRRIDMLPDTHALKAILLSSPQITG
jgi:hypothetical protein